MPRTGVEPSRADPMGGDDLGGVYVHVPFCRRRCHFCAFAVTTRLDSIDAWRRAVVAEIGLRAPAFDVPVDTIYLGGGTPSLLPADAVAEILAAVEERFEVREDPEITLEANPGTLSAADLAALRRAGVNRLSLGIQSFFDEDLRFLTREHSGKQGEDSICMARGAGFENLSADLMYGLPDRPRERLAADVERLAELGVDHVSAYLLTFEEHTPFYARAKRGAIRRLSEEEEREVLLFARDRLRRAGFPPYEVSSFATEPRFRSRHNRKYWSGAPYLGVGPGAHSFRDPRRSWNLPGVRPYVAALQSGRLPPRGFEDLTADERLLERLFLGLRTSAGVDLRILPDLSSTARSELRRLVGEGKAEIEKGRLRLTEEGVAVADAIATFLADAAQDGNR